MSKQKCWHTRSWYKAFPSNWILMPFSHSAIAALQLLYPFRNLDKLNCPGTHRPTHQGSPPNQTHSALVSSLLFTQLYCLLRSAHLVFVALFSRFGCNCFEYCSIVCSVSSPKIKINPSQSKGFWTLRGL